MAEEKTRNAVQRMLNGGMQKEYKFDNGYGASVVCSPYSYGGTQGLWEIAVLHSDEIVYDTPVTDDVIGYLSETEVEEILDQIEALPPRTTETGAL